MSKRVTVSEVKKRDYLEKGKATANWGIVIGVASLFYALIAIGLLSGKGAVNGDLLVALGLGIIGGMLLFVGVSIIQLLKDIKKEIIDSINKN